MAQRARAAAAILALAAGLSLRREWETGAADFFEALYLAQRALCAAAILARPAALIPDPLEEADEAPPPRIWLSSYCNESIFSLISAARRSCCVDRFDNSLIGIEWPYDGSLARAF